MQYSSFTKGLAAGFAVGTAVTMFINPISDKQKHRLYKKTEGVFKNIGGIIDTAFDMMK